MSAPYVELDTPLSDDAVVCRGCLADSGEMKDIREWNLVEDFRKYAGVQLRRSDAISELICTSCEDLLKKCKQFMMQCMEADATLRNYTMNKKKMENISVRSENTVTYMFNQNCLIYTIVAPDLTKNIYIPCPYNCKDKFTKKSDILAHLVKVHKHSKDYDIEYYYHCWEEDCQYHKDAKAEKYFIERKCVNQHFNKVHKTKVIHCDKCEVDFTTDSEYTRHHKSCNMVFVCEDCKKQYSKRERLLVHLLRHHPKKHQEYKNARKAEKRKAAVENLVKKPKLATVQSLFETDSPKRSFATQTLHLKSSIKNDVRLPPWQNNNTEISTQTGYEDMLSVKSNSEDDSLFYSETTLNDIQTQTFPLEFGLFVNRSHKETLTESVDMSIKGTQTCLCYCDSPKMTFGALDSVSQVSSPRSGNVTSTETQTADFGSDLASHSQDMLLSLNSTETQTCFDAAFKESL